jgi:hypothetical protein
MRQYALNKGYTFNEHGIYVLVDKVKGEKVEQLFVDEKSIFDFLGYNTRFLRIEKMVVL